MRLQIPFLKPPHMATLILAALSSVIPGATTERAGQSSVGMFEFQDYFTALLLPCLCENQHCKLICAERIQICIIT